MYIFKILISIYAHVFVPPQMSLFPLTVEQSARHPNIPPIEADQASARQSLYIHHIYVLPLISLYIQVSLKLR